MPKVFFIGAKARGGMEGYAGYFLPDEPISFAWAYGYNPPRKALMTFKEAKSFYMQAQVASGHIPSAASSKLIYETIGIYRYNKLNGTATLQ